MSIFIGVLFQGIPPYLCLMPLLQQIQNLSQTYAPEIVSIRRHIHSHPELSYQEFETAKFIFEKLTAFGLNPTQGIAGTGVVVMV